jgi:hypothetical protein
MHRFHHVLLLCILSISSLTSCKKDKCEDKVCANGGTCNEGTCTCAAGFEGENCNTEIRSKYYGLYNGVYDCVGGPDVPGPMEVRAGSSGTNSLIFDDGSFPFNVDLNGTAFTIRAGQGISGSGNFNGNQLVLNYVYSGVSCQFTGSK